jgi:hypothetical protein
LDVLPTAESLFSAAALGANSAWGLGYPGDRASLEFANASLNSEGAMQLNCVRWYDRDILELNEQDSPFCCELGSNYFLYHQIRDDRSRWAVFAFWRDMSRNKQNHLIALCASKMSLVTSLAVCEDSNWASETAGWFTPTSRSRRPQRLGQ